MLFVLYSLLSTGLLIFAVPPFQHPEELNQFLRASQLADGGLVGRRFMQSSPNGPSYVTAGGKIDPAIVQAAWPFVPMVYHSDVHTSAAMWLPARHWSAVRRLWQFPNTVVYPPAFYTPAVAAIGVGRVTHMTVLHTLLLGRLLTALAFIAIGTLAIKLAGAAAPWLFTVLLLPMSQDIATSVSQDGLMLACSALAGALLVRALGRNGAGAQTACIAMAALLSLVAMARPPYLALTLLPLLVTAVPWRTRIAVTTASATAVVAWSALSALFDLTNPGADFGANTAAQAAYLWRHAFAFPGILLHTMGKDYLDLAKQFVGRLGWDDTKLPTPYYYAAFAMLALAAATSATARPRVIVPAPRRAAILAASLLATVGIFLSLYLAWTVPGYFAVGGVEGRYFLPMAVAGSALLMPAAVNRPAWLHRARQIALAGVVTFPVFSVLVVLHTLALRYGES